MNRFDEPLYNLWLSDLIRSKKKSSLFFTGKNAGQHQEMGM